MPGVPTIPRQVQPHQAADNADRAGGADGADSAGPQPATWPPEQTWRPEEVLTGEIQRGPFAPETDIYGNPVPGHYRTGVRYADADAAIDNDHFSAGRTVWSAPNERGWTPEQPPRPGPPVDPTPSGAEPPIPKAPPMRPTLSSALRPRGPVGPPPAPTSGFTPSPAPPSGITPPPQRSPEPLGPPSDFATPPAQPTGYGPQRSGPAGYVPRPSAPAAYPPQPSAPAGYAPQPSAPTGYPPEPSGYASSPAPPTGYDPDAAAPTQRAAEAPIAPQVPPPGHAQPGYPQPGYPQPPQPGAPGGYAPQSAPPAAYTPEAAPPSSFSPPTAYAPEAAPPSGFSPPAAYAPEAAPPNAYGHPAQSTQPPSAGPSLSQQSTLSQQFARRTSPTSAYTPAAETATGAADTAAATSSAPAPPAPTSAPPRIAPPPPKKSSSSGRKWFVALGAAILAIAIAGGALIGLNLASRSDDRQPGSLAGASCGGKPVLTVAVAPEFAAIVEKAAAAMQGAAQGCSPVKVAAQEPAVTLSQLANNPPDAWIPPSTAWLRMSGPRRASAPGSRSPTTATEPSDQGSSTEGPTGSPTPGSAPATSSNGIFAPDAVSLARSPVVVAAPKPFAEANGWPDKQLGWTQLTAGVISHQIPKFSMGNPLRDTASLLAVLSVQVAMAGTTKDPGIAQMRALTLRARLADADADSTVLLKKAAGLTDPATAGQELGLFPATEQELWQYNRESHPLQLAAMYPGDTLMEADYPFAVTTKTAGDQARRDIATKLTDLITARTFIGSLTDQGFRPAAKTAATAGAGIALAPNATGLIAQYGRAIPLPPQIAEPAAIWARYKQLTFQTLILVDGSGSMNDPVKLRDGTQSTKADLLRLAGTQAAQLYGEETSLAMWLFASPRVNGVAVPGTPPFQVVVPFGPVNDKINGVPRRDVMRTAAASYKAIPTAGTPLYETVLRGVEDMKKRQKPNTVTMVVVLTDGRDEDSPYQMSQQQFLQRLGALQDRARPLPVFAIGYGADADMNGLSQMAKLTGGQAVASNDPGDLASAVAKIFLAAHLR